MKYALGCPNGSLMARKGTPPNLTKPVKKSNIRHSYGIRLNAVMDFAEISNIRLSLAVNVDASLISRFRTGIRTPQTNPVLAKSISEALWTQIEKKNLLTELSHIMDVSPELLDRIAFHTWLCDFSDERDEGAMQAELLMDSLESLTSKKITIFPPSESAPLTSLDDTRTIYSGISGLRDAVIRFLEMAFQDHAEELLLYSEQNMDWMTEDPDFRLKWASLMVSCLQNGTKIRIIHNIERDLLEMYEAIAAWFPLYLSGNIEPYYNTKEKGSRTALTIFLRPHHACITGNPAIGHEETAIYHYHVSDSVLDGYQETFNALMEDAKPLIKFKSRYTALDEINSISLDARTRRKSEIVLVQPVLSLASMPEEVMRRFASPALEAAWHQEHEILEDALITRSFSECVPLASDETLYQGIIPVERFSDTETLFYTPELYALHVNHITRLLREHPNYNFCALSEAPFDNIKILASSEYTLIFHPAFSTDSICFLHPLMCRAFSFWAKNLQKQAHQNRATLIRHLTLRYPEE